MPFDGSPPLGLYVHLPWCERKCPYCDFNSHEGADIPEDDYVDALLDDLGEDLPLVWGRRIETLFIGGGTPSLFSGAAIDRLLGGLRALTNFAPSVEITLESNPGSADAGRYRDYRAAGVNRLSIGVQSFDDRALAVLGRVHDSADARRAVELARAAGFDNLNLDLMYGLPGQGLADAVADLEQALALAPEHLSHYQLTIEPNTLFHHRPPAGLPDDELAWRQQRECQARLAAAGYAHYEISAYARPGREARHNLNYWYFGDYLGIGAGAHGKLTLAGEERVVRRVRLRQPRAYLAARGPKRIARETVLGAADLVFEFMLNATRLVRGFDARLFHQVTGLGLGALLPGLNHAKNKGLVEFDGHWIRPTELGLRFLNDLQALFLDSGKAPSKPIFESKQGIIHN